MKSIIHWLSLCTLIVTCLGCGKKDPLNRVHLKGTITFQGNPVSAGVIIFEPDATKGNRGPQGTSLIKDGAFDTSIDHGKPIVPGPVRVQIHGFNGLNRTDLAPYGDALFPIYTTEIDVHQETPKMNFEIPTKR